MLGKHNIGVSVVMSVYDKPDEVGSTVRSVLAQQGVDLELIVVSDGASSDVLDVLTAFDDARLHVILQENQGLTEALINGCNTASHAFIARIDSGDRMRKGRLLQQARHLEANPNAALVACGVHTHTQEGFALYDVQYNSSELKVGLSASEINDFKSPVHASVMFRKSAYHAVGGYRPEFYFTQDCDLWARMCHEFDVGAIEEVLQDCVFSAGGISGLYTDFQRKLEALVVESNRLRQSSASDIGVLARAKELRPEQKSKTVSDEFNGNYFIAAVLSAEQPLAAIVYWRRALKIRPWHVKSWFRYALCTLKSFLSR